MPKFDKLAKSLSTTFPFNIPFDLHQSLINLFVKMGSDKPSYDMTISFSGKSYNFDLTFPKFFDEWQPFVRSAALFIFDIGLLYAAYRFISNGG